MLLGARSIAPKQEDSSMEAWRNRPGRASVSTGRGWRTCRRATSATLGSFTRLAARESAVRELSRHVGHAAVGMGPHPRARASRHLSYGTLARRSTTLALRPGITYRCWPASQAPYATALPSRTGCCPSVQTIAATSESWTGGCFNLPRRPTGPAESGP